MKIETSFPCWLGGLLLGLVGVTAPSSGPARAADGAQNDEPSIAELESQLLEFDGGMIELNDSTCLAGGCAENCAKHPKSCPGGERAAMKRGWWKRCSEIQWRDENCDTLVAMVGRHSQTDPFSVPGEYRSLYTALRQGTIFQLTEDNLAFVSGLGTYLVDTCEILPLAEARTVKQFASSGAIYASTGNNYPNPGENVGGAIGGALTLGSGFALGQSIACRLPEAYVLAMGMAASIKASEGTAKAAANGDRDGDGSSRFVRTCTPHFSASQCQCLGDLGRSVIPSIHTQAYESAVIAEIIQRNPLVGLGISLRCGINQY
jgi:hypothetical protein